MYLGKAGYIYSKTIKGYNTNQTKFLKLYSSDLCISKSWPNQDNNLKYRKITTIAKGAKSTSKVLSMQRHINTQI